MENLVSVHFKCLYGLIHFRENNLNYEQDYTFGVALHNCSNTILYKVHKCTEYSMLLSVVTFTDGLKLHIYKDN